MAAVYELHLANNCHNDWCSFVRTSLLDAFKSHDKIILHADHVEKIGTPALQMILSLSNACTENDKTLVINNPSKIFINNANILGIADNFKQWGDFK